MMGLYGTCVKPPAKTGPRAAVEVDTLQEEMRCNLSQMRWSLAQ